MRVLFFIEANQRRPQAVEVIRAYLARGIELDYVTMLPRSDLHKEAADVGARAHALDVDSSRGFPAAAYRLSRILAVRRPEVIHCVEPVPATLGAIAAMPAGSGLRVFHRQHLTAAWPQTLFARTANRLAQLVIACSEAAGERSVREGVPRSRVCVVHNGAAPPRRVHKDELVRLRQQLGISASARIVCSVARLRPEKGLQVAVKALPRIAAKLDQPLHYVVAGDGPYRHDLERLAESTPVPVHLVGDQVDVAPWLQLGEVIMMPSFHEALGIAGAEAMAAGKPLVATATGGLTELVVDGTTGLLVPPGNPTELADAVERLLRSPDRAASMGEAARNRFHAQFSIERMVDGCLRCYQEALAR